jgi:hypothetical protein
VRLADLALEADSAGLNPIPPGLPRSSNLLLYLSLEVGETV